MTANTLPARVTAALETFVRASSAALGADLQSIVLFGSAATGQLRTTSDVNVLVLLRRFDPQALDRLRPAAEAARLQLNVRPMWILVDELALAAEAFALKYGDIAQRHVVLHGTDPFDGLHIPRAALVAQLRQSLLNTVLRLRAQFVDHAEQETRLALTLADAMGPLRVAAATLAALSGSPAASPKQALAQLAGPGASDALHDASTVREGGTLPPGAARRALLVLIGVARDLHLSAQGVQP